jgi:hypothetical protein
MHFQACRRCPRGLPYRSGAGLRVRMLAVHIHRYFKQCAPAQPAARLNAKGGRYTTGRGTSCRIASGLERKLENTSSAMPTGVHNAARVINVDR